MFLSDISVKRPVFASVISLILIVFGIVAFQGLPLREYPNIDPPIVTVEVEYPGAPASVVETRITERLEERIAGIAGIEYISSESTDGESQITIEFSTEIDLDSAVNDVRDRISGIADNLPEEASLPEVQKADSNDDVIIWRNLTSTQMTVPELTDYARRYLVERYSTLPGVARVRVGGGLNYAMRVWLDREEMAARNISVTDIEQALRQDNIELPAGSLESNQVLFQARVDRNFKAPEDFKNLVIGQGLDGYLIRLNDVATVELGVVEKRTFFHGNGIPMVGIGVIRQSTANTIEVTDGVIKLTNMLNKTLPPGMKIEESYNAGVFIKSAIDSVYSTLLIAIACVIFVIYLFLGNIRSMIIPAITVPISLIATFIVMYSFNFSINILTLLALVLAIGLVVDDAIVMLENILRRIIDYKEKPLIAAYKGARQVAFAIIATTLVLIAVFVPITFLKGDLGRLFTEFAVTISAAVAFSSLIALTLSPMLASKLLKSQQSNNFKLVTLFIRLIDSLKNAYQQAISKLIHKPIIMIVIFFTLIATILFLYPKINKEFSPQEDRGAFFIIVNGPDGASYSYMEEYMLEIEKRLMSYVDKGEIKRLLIRAPRSFGNLQNFNSGFVIAILDDWANRRDAKVIMNEIRNNLSNLPGIVAFPVMRQGLGGGTSKPVEFVIGGNTYDELIDWSNLIISEIEKNNPGFLGLESDFNPNRPQIDFVVDYDKAASLGVTINDIGKTLETMMGGRNLTTYINNGEEYDVIIEGIRDKQRNINDISNIYVRSQRTGELIPISNLVHIKQFGSLKTLPRYNRVRSVTLSANLEDNYKLGDAIKHLQDLVKEKLPLDTVIDYKGQSKEFIDTSSSIIFIFLLGLLTVFLVLAAQFESFVHPFIIILTVPLAIAGGLFGLYLTNNSINIYSQIGLIILIGLAAKNGILMVEFTNQLREKGYDFEKAIVEAATVRFRPIIMTALTTIAGSIPLIIATGAGKETRNVIGVVIFFGVLIATFFTLFIIPVAYKLIAKNTKPPGYVAKQLESANDSNHQ